MNSFDMSFIDNKYASIYKQVLVLIIRVFKVRGIRVSCNLGKGLQGKYFFGQQFRGAFHRTDPLFNHSSIMINKQSRNVFFRIIWNTILSSDSNKFQHWIFSGHRNHAFVQNLTSVVSRHGQIRKLKKKL